MADLNSTLLEISARLAAIESHLGISGGSGGDKKSSGGAELPRSIKAFDAYTAENLDPFVEVCNKLGGDAALSGNAIKEAWLEMRAYLLRASASKEPTREEIPAAFAGVAAKVKVVNDVVKRNEWEKHTKTCSEGVQALNWLVVKPAPADFIESYIGGSDYWSNNIRREYKTTNPDQVAFCENFKNLLKNLIAYVKEYHTTGVTWNPKGGSFKDYAGSANAEAQQPAPAAAQKPAATTAPTTSTTPASKPAPGAALFGELNKGGDITSGLKTVTKDMQTWRKEYKGGDAPTPAPKAPTTKAAVEVVKGPPKFEYQDASSKWVVENYTSANGTANIEIKDKKETVYIYGCNGATIDITGKCKSIIVDSCKKTTIYFDAAMASAEVVNSQRINIHCRDKVPAVAIDKTDGIVVHLPASSLDSSIVASKSSEMNVSFPGTDGEPIERPIPEQYVHKISGTSITAEVSDLYTH